MEQITIGIPAFNARNYLKDVLASIQIQTIRNKCKVIIASDTPGEDYKDIISCYPELNIDFLPCEKNIGPGGTRRKILEYCTTEWITFIDADDIFFTPFALELLYNAITDKNIVLVQGMYIQENQVELSFEQRLTPINNIWHASCAARLYNVNFLRFNNISFSNLRSMEDGEFNYKIKFLIESQETLYQQKIIDDPIYLWKFRPETITKVGAEKNNGIPIYNWDLGAISFTVALINVIDFCKQLNISENDLQYNIIEIMFSHYALYKECLHYAPFLKELSIFNAKRFYFSCYQPIESKISREKITEYFQNWVLMKGEKNLNLYTFLKFLEKLKNETFGGEEEFSNIRKKLPDWVLDYDQNFQVLNPYNYLYTDNELKDLNLTF